MQRDRQTTISATRPIWQRRIAQLLGMCGILLLTAAFAALPVAASGHDGGKSDGDRHGGEVENQKPDNPGHDMMSGTNDRKGEVENEKVDVEHPTPEVENENENEHPQPEMENEHADAAPVVVVRVDDDNPRT